MTTQMSVTAKSVISSIDGIKIYAEAIGDPQKPALVYIHGWYNQFFDDQLTARFYQVRLDLRGHGLSETPDPESAGPYDNEKQASDLAAVLEAFGVQNPIFVSWSYGALIPADYMSVYGYKGVRGIVVANGITGIPPDVMKFFNMEPNPGFMDNSDATKMHHSYTKFINHLTVKPLTREWTLRLRGMLTETETATRQWVWKRKKDWDVYMGDASENVPKLVLFGKEDAMNSITFVDYIKTKWEPSLLTTQFIEEAGHAAFLEKPEEFNAILLEWARGIASV